MRKLIPGYKLLVVGLILGFAISSLPRPAEASFICNRYGSCQYCDFYSDDGTYQGHITDCP